METEIRVPYTPEQLLQTFLLKINAYTSYLDATTNQENLFGELDIVTWWRKIATPTLRNQLISRHLLILKKELRVQSYTYDASMLMIKQFYSAFKKDFTQEAKNFIIKCELYRCCPPFDCQDMTLWQDFINVSNRSHYLEKVFPTMSMNHPNQLRQFLHEWIDLHE